MAVFHELTFTGQSVYELAFSDRFFAGNQALIVLHTTELSRRLHRCDRGQLLIGMLELHQYLDTVTPFASKNKF